MPKAQIQTSIRTWLHNEWSTFRSEAHLHSCALARWVRRHMNDAGGEDMNGTSSLTSGGYRGCWLASWKRWWEKNLLWGHSLLVANIWHHLGHELTVERMIHVLEREVHENSSNPWDRRPVTCKLQQTCLVACALGVGNDPENKIYSKWNQIYIKHDMNLISDAHTICNAPTLPCTCVCQFLSKRVTQVPFIGEGKSSPSSLVIYK